MNKQSIYCILNPPDIIEVDHINATTNKLTKKYGKNIQMKESAVEDYSGVVVSFQGYIYNYNELLNLLNFDKSSISIHKIIIYLYKTYGIEYTIQLLDGVFSFILYDYDCLKEVSNVYVVRDAFGLIPLYEKRTNNTIEFSSRRGKGIHEIKNGTYSVYQQTSKVLAEWELYSCNQIYYTLPPSTITGFMDIYYWRMNLNDAMYETMEKILLSQLDESSSIVVLNGSSHLNIFVENVIRKYKLHNIIFHEIDKHILNQVIIHSGGFDELFGVGIDIRNIDVFLYDQYIRQNVQSFYQSIPSNTLYHYPYLNKKFINMFLTIPLQLRIQYRDFLLNK